MKCTVVVGQEVFITLTHKHSEDSKQSPLSVKCPRLCIEQSCMVMSSVWITLGSQTHVRSRLHLPLLFASSLHPLMTSWRSACLYIMSNTKDLGAVHEKTCSYQPSCSSCVPCVQWVSLVFTVHICIVCLCMCTLHFNNLLNPRSHCIIYYHLFF